MFAVLGVLFAFVAIIVLRLKDVDFTLALVAGSVITALSSGRFLETLVEGGTHTLIDPTTFDLCAAIALITLLGYALKETGLMSELIEGLRSVLPTWALLAAIPSMFGLLTMPGGALMSAPFNEPEADRLNLKPEQKTYINVWFRHIWYWGCPISPVPILASSLACLSLNSFLITQLPLFVVMLTIGFIVTSTFIRRGGVAISQPKRYRDVAKGLAPIAAAVGLALVKIPVWLALIVAVGMVFVIKRVPPRNIVKMTRKGVRWDLAIAALATLFFRYVIEASQSMNTLLGAFNGLGVPLILLLIVMPILVGTISGTPTMGIGIIFPVLLPFCGLSLHMVSLMYAGVIVGYIGSPIHLCLVLTNDYYKSNLSKVHRYLIPSVAALYLSALFYYLGVSGNVPT